MHQSDVATASENIDKIKNKIGREVDPLFWFKGEGELIQGTVVQLKFGYRLANLVSKI